MSIRVHLTAAMLAFALCGCATTAVPSKSTVASVNCADHAARGNTLASDTCARPGERSYSQADLQRTGKTSAGDALALLDPAIVVKH